MKQAIRPLTAFPGNIAATVDDGVLRGGHNYSLAWSVLRGGVLLTAASRRELKEAFARLLS